MLLVDQAGHHDGGWDGVEHREEPNADHQPLQFVRLGATLLDDASDAEERNKTCEQEQRTSEEVNHQRSKYESPEVLQTLVPNVADPSHRVPIHRAEGQDHDGLDAGDEPSGEVEVLRVSSNGLAAPLHPCSQEPGEGQHHPPDGTGHAEEVHQQEDEGAESRACGVVEDVQLVSTSTAAGTTGHPLMTCHQADDITQGDEEVAGSQEDDGPLWVLEALHVNEEGGHSGQGGDEAQHRPEAHPEAGEGPFIS